MDIETSVPEKLRSWRRSAKSGDVGDDPAAESLPESLMATAAAIGAGVLTRRALHAAWKRLRSTEPPTNPSAPDVGWVDALTWAVAVGAAVGVSRVLSRRGATAAARRWHS